MANKRGVFLPEKERKILQDFLACRVPAKYYELDGRGNTKFDFNYNYEEIYDYADALLHGQEVSLRHNFVGLRSVAVNEEFRKVLDVIGRRDISLSDLCDKFSAAILVIGRFARKD